MVDARRGEIFVPARACSQPEELDVDGTGARRRRRDPLPRAVRSARRDDPADDDPVHLPDPLLLVERAGPFGAAELVEPLYVRDPDAKPSA